MKAVRQLKSLKNPSMKRLSLRQSAPLFAKPSSAIAMSKKNPSFNLAMSSRPFSSSSKALSFKSSPLFHSKPLSVVSRTPKQKSLFVNTTPKFLNSHRSFSATPGSVSLFTEEEQQLRESVKSFAQTEIKPIREKMDRENLLDKGLLNKMFAQGLMGIETSTDFNGAGMSFTSSIIVIEELAKVDAAVSVICDVQNTLVNNIFFRFATPDQQKKYLTKLATDTVGSFCLSETGSGSDAFALKTTAEKQGEHYILNGSKAWITNALEAGIYLVQANVDPSKGYRGITTFAVERDNPGLRIGKKEDKLGIRASSTCEVILENCKVHESDIIGEVGKGYKIAIETLNEGRIGIAAQMLGLAEGALEETLPYITQRKQFGKPISEFQGMQFQIAEAAVEIETAKTLVYNAARLKDMGQPFIKEAAMAKLHASRVAERVSSSCINMLGGVGFTKEFPAEKFFRDCKIGQIYEGTSNIQLQTIAKQLLANYK